MKYKATFQRINFYFDPPLYQTSDVVLETDIPFNDDCLEDFDAALWAAAFEQNPHFKNPTGPCNTSWSSIRHIDGKVIKL